MRVSPCNARMHISHKWFHDRRAGGDDADVDFEEARDVVGETDPGDVFGFGLPGEGCAGDGDGAGSGFEGRKGV
ncbi:MAG: hypothetical protein Q9190_004052, partial [Brigantiaea leucoxantha]